MSLQRSFSWDLGPVFQSEVRIAVLLDLSVWLSPHKDVCCKIVTHIRGERRIRVVCRQINERWINEESISVTDSVQSIIPRSRRSSHSRSWGILLMPNWSCRRSKRRVTMTDLSLWVLILLHLLLLLFPKLLSQLLLKREPLLLMMIPMLLLLCLKYCSLSLECL